MSFDERLRATLADKAREVDARPLPELDREVVMTLEPEEPPHRRRGWVAGAAVALAAAGVVAVALLFGGGPAPRSAVEPPADTPPASAVEPVVVPIPEGCDGEWGVVLERGDQVVEVLASQLGPPSSGVTEVGNVGAGTAGVFQQGRHTIVYVELFDASTIAFSSTFLDQADLLAIAATMRQPPDRGGRDADEVVIPLPSGFRATQGACAVG